METAPNKAMPRSTGYKKSSIEISLPEYSMSSLETLAEFLGKPKAELARELVEMAIPIYLKDRVNPIEEFQQTLGKREIARKVGRKLDLSIERLEKGENS